MKRTQIYLDEDLDRELRIVASLEGRSAAAVIREAVRDYLAALGRRPSGDPILAVAGSICGGSPDASERHDDALYRS